MSLNLQTTRQHLQEFDFRKLFINELGWNNPPFALKPADAEAKGGLRFHRAPVAVLSGIHVFEITTPGGAIPDAKTRAAIHAATTKIAAENILIFTDKARTHSLWYWVKREAGKTHRRPHLYVKGQPGDLFISKLDALRVDISELDAKGHLAPGEGNRRVKKALDVERVTKKFYDQFTKEHAAFLKSFAACIPVKSDAEWYASVMLNRLMFVYFIQHKGFLDNDRDYLRTRLNLTRREHGKDQFHFFYRRFLIKLFHEGLGGKKRTTELEKLIGRIPYLNGGMFDVHELEKKYDTGIEIPDAAFERIFDYFDKYDWVLDPEHSVRAPGDREEINPDVLGYIFEKYINQKQMGAYYTKEDITEYISKNTIIPFLFDAARKECSVALDGSSSRCEEAHSKPGTQESQSLVTSAATQTVWDLLAKNPDRYIYDAVKKGVELPLPKTIEAGIKDVSKRDGWNKSADAEFALPTEIWREVVARRLRCEEIRNKLAAGEVRDINALITLNLDIRRFALDVIENCEGPDLLRAFWRAITRITVLDPTCGSGAFIFAALNILEPLYEACLDRMTEFLNDEAVKHAAAALKFTAHGYPLLPGGKFEDFAHTLEHVACHVSPQYFTYKSIILQNLFGVDIMPEAVEICKLRLFLKLAAQVAPDARKENLGIEPLPDIDFNICAGNTLVGYATLAEVQNSMFGRNYLERIQKADAQIRRFRQRQSQTAEPAEQRENKQQIRALLDEIREKLDMSLFTDYGARELTAWKKSHQPFHWYVEFNSIIQSGGFDVIIGNPPYVAAAKVRKSYSVKGFATDNCTDIYAWILERSHTLLHSSGRTGMIVPLSIGFSSDFDACRRLLFSGYSDNWFSSFGRIPAALFNFDVRVRNTIHLALKSERPKQNYTTRLHRWFETARPALFQTLEYAPFQPTLWKHRIPKLNTAALAKAFERAFGASSRTLEFVISPRATKHVLHFKKTAYNWLNFCREMPPCYEGSRRVSHTQFDSVCFPDSETRDIASLAFNGKLLMIFWFVVGDDFHVTKWNFTDFPTDFSSASEQQRAKLLAIAPELDQAMEAAVQFKLNAGRKVGNYNLAKCRDVTDMSDRILAEALGFADVWEDIELYYAQTMKTDFSDDDE